jgi:hypothetical protein
MSRRTVTGLIVIVAIVFAVVTTQQCGGRDGHGFELYWVRDGFGFELYWTSDEAYLFVSRNRLGWELTPVEVITGYVREFLGSSIPVSRTRQSLTAVWFTKDAADTQTFEDMKANRFKIIEGTLFLDSQRKWVRARLEQTTTGEQQQYDQAPRSPAPEYSNFKGWSYRCCMGLPADTKLSKIPLTLDGEPVQFIFQNGAASGQLEVLLKRAGRLTPLLTLNNEPRHVSGNEYFELMTTERK